MQTIHYFAGANTVQGFYSRFEEIPRDCQRVYYIKGGPGVGKSTLMKRVAQRAQEKGLEAEIFHCSSDPDSLDGVALPHFENPMVGVFASMIEPTIVRRLKGSEYGKRKAQPQNKDESLPEGTPEDTLEDTLEGTPQGTLQPSKAKQSKAERTLAKRSLAEYSGAEGAHVREGEEGTSSYAPQETPSLDLQAAPQVAPRQPPAPVLREEREAVVFVEQKTPPMHQGDTSEALAFGTITPRRTPEPASAARIRSRSRTGFPSHREPLRQSPASSHHSDRSSAQFRSSA